MQTDLAESAKWEYQGTQVDPADFDQFWADTLAGARIHAPDVHLAPVETGLETLDVFYVSYRGFDGERVHAWLRAPRDAATGTSRLPAVVHFNGYGAGRGDPLDDLAWASAGFVHLLMGTRGQGSSGSDGADPATQSATGFTIRGISSPKSYYYRRVFTDAVRAVDAVRSLAFVDGANVAVLGNSQGGGIALATAGLVPDLGAALFQAPFLCDLPGAIVSADSMPYAEITGYLRDHQSGADQAVRTLSYFDGVNFARRATAPGYFSIGLMDRICPPSTVFAAHNNYAAPRDIAIWPDNGHEAGGTDDRSAAIKILHRHLRPATPADQTPAPTVFTSTKRQEEA